MFSDKKIAAQVNEDLLAVNVLVNYSLLKIKDRCPKEEYERYRKLISKVIILNFDILPEIWTAHPSLMPQDFRKEESPIATSAHAAKKKSRVKRKKRKK